VKYDWKLGWEFVFRHHPTAGSRHAGRCADTYRFDTGSTYVPGDQALRIRARTMEVTPAGSRSAGQTHRQAAGGQEGRQDNPEHGHLTEEIHASRTSGPPRTECFSADGGNKRPGGAEWECFPQAIS
jgi:hypothetical protein